MKNFNKLALVSAIAVASGAANAELTVLDDASLSGLTGQSGLTIDIETKYTIGEFMYKDEGAVFFNGISFAGNTNEGNGGAAWSDLNSADYVDNIRVKLDIAGAGESLDTGWSGVRTTADVQATGAATNGGNAAEADFLLAAAGSITVAAAQNAGLVDATVSNVGPLTIEDKKTYNDGDLLIHVSYKDAWQKVGGFVGLNEAGTFGDVTLSGFFHDGIAEAKDFNFAIDAIGLAASTVAPGETVSRVLMGHTATGLDNDGVDTTVLISDLSVNGYLGVLDIHIQNNGNGFEDNYGGSENYGAADSKISINQYIDITDLDVYLDIAGVDIQDLKINNQRGDVTDLEGNFSFGFAQTERTIYAVKDTAGFSAGASVAIAAAGAQSIDAILNQGKDGIALDTRFKGDKEIGYLGFGDTDGSIGELYWTDITSDSKWTISAH